MNTREQIIEQTKKWIVDVVVGCNFCPFAAKEVKQNTIRYQVESSANTKVCLQSFLLECELLDDNDDIETTILILPNAAPQFNVYLDMVELAEKILVRKEYEGVYQVASFHPHYCFAKSEYDDASNYTNRSPYPMLHLLREERITEALMHYANPEQIPERNINFARQKGSAYMKMLRDACL